jgi:hypothetical protein
LQLHQREVERAWFFSRKHIENLVDAVIVLEDKLLLVDFHHTLEIYWIVEEFHQRLHIRHVRSLKSFVFPYETFNTTESGRAIEMELWLVLREKVFL